MKYEDDFMELIRRAERGEKTTVRVPAFTDFDRDFAKLLQIDDVQLPLGLSSADLFGWGFQIRRAFHHAFRKIYGGSESTAGPSKPRATLHCSNA
jgi:hypothetical protein